MAGNKSNYLSKALIDYALGSTAWTPPASVYFGLWTEELTDESDGSASGEPTDVAYERVGAVDNNNDGSLWPTATGTSTAVKSNLIALTWPTAEENWGTITHFAICDDSGTGAGNILFWGELTTPKVISTGDTASFSATALVVTED